MYQCFGMMKWGMIRHWDLGSIEFKEDLSWVVRREHLSYGYKAERIHPCVEWGQMVLGRKNQVQVQRT